MAGQRKFGFQFGPERIPFSLGPNGSVECGSPAAPFHGIISRGLLGRLTERGESIEVWHRYAHRIHDGRAAADAVLTRLRIHAAECVVLSFGQSALATKRVVETHCDSLIDRDRDVSCTLWNIKEGHTSSVWQIAICGIHDGETDEFIVNVARDAEAGRELKATSEKMLAITRQWPEANLAKVLSIREIPLDYYGAPIQVQVTCNELVRDGHEIHSLANRAMGQDRLVLVERFMASDPDRPSQIRSIRGRELTGAECRKVKADVSDFLARAGRRFPVDVDLTDGDIVWNGRQAIVIAIR